MTLRTAEELQKLTIMELAMIIGNDTAPVSVHAKPYLDAMYGIGSINDMYVADTAYSIVAYFLSNAGTWRGDAARLIKAELKRRMKLYEKQQR